MSTLRLSLLTMAFFALAACSGKKTPTPTKKTQTTKLTAPTQAEPEVTKEEPKDAVEEAEPLNEEDAKTILIGIWRVDVKSLGKKPQVDDLADDEEAARAIQYRTMTMVAFEFAPDGRFTQFLGQQILRGKYKIEKATGNVLRLTTQVRGKTNNMTVTVTEDNLVLKQKGQSTLQLERGAPKIPGSAP